MAAAAVRFSFHSRPRLIACEKTFFTPASGRDEPFATHLSFSPDGMALAAATMDGRVGLFTLPHLAFDHEWTPARPAGLGAPFASVPSCGPLYDMAWYPGTDYTAPGTACFAIATRDLPVRLIDGVSGMVRASYSVKDEKDEIVSALSLAMDPTGRKLLAGRTRRIHVFDVARPSAAAEVRATAKSRRAQGQKGMLGALAVSPDRSGMFAAGSYDGSLVLYDLRDRRAQHRLVGHSRGITALAFTPDGQVLVSGARKEQAVMVWDVRRAHMPLFELPRPSHTNQKLQVSVDESGSLVLVGTSESRALVYDVMTGREVWEERRLQDACACVAMHPRGVLFAVGAGQRRVPLPGGDPSDDSSDGEDEGERAGGGAAAPRRPAPPRASVCLFRTGYRHAAPEEDEEDARKRARADASAEAP